MVDKILMPQAKSRPRFTFAEEFCTLFVLHIHKTPEKMAGPQVHTYHCICNELVAAVVESLEDVFKRSKDNATICTISPTSPSKGSAVLSSSAHIEEEAIVLKLEDGFEKRYAVRCGRCDLQVGYMLDKASFDEASSGRKGDVMYLLPGGLMSTEEMKDGKDMSKEVGFVAGAAG